MCIYVNRKQRLVINNSAIATKNVAGVTQKSIVGLYYQYFYNQFCFIYTIYNIRKLR